MFRTETILLMSAFVIVYKKLIFFIYNNYIAHNFTYVKLAYEQTQGIKSNQKC